MAENKHSWLWLALFPWGTCLRWHPVKINCKDHEKNSSWPQGWAVFFPKKYFAHICCLGKIDCFNLRVILMLRMLGTTLSNGHKILDPGIWGIVHPPLKQIMHKPAYHGPSLWCLHLLLFCLFIPCLEFTTVGETRVLSWCGWRMLLLLSVPVFFLCLEESRDSDISILWLCVCSFRNHVSKWRNEKTMWWGQGWQWEVRPGKRGCRQ